MKGKGPRRVDAAYLERSALFYLERFASSSANLRRVLMAKVTRSARAHGTDPAEGARFVEALITRFIASGFLDDRAYALAKAASLGRRGASKHAIKQRLAVKGLPGELIDVALQEHGELASAAALARRRRLGPYRALEARASYYAKDLASFARAGFSLETARRVLACADEAALLAECENVDY
ncbi:MAG TPA: RecX family transcriptional regulator [Stellaceae bacterium]|nr:RecX family transcriptional regulator [Stellaceae bacterium]